jgi:hypothetical protein
VEAVKLRQVELPLLDAEHIPRRACHQPRIAVPTKPLAQLRHLHLEIIRGTRRRRFAPQQVNEPVS